MRKSFLHVSLAAAVAAFCAPAQSQQAQVTSYPSKPIRILVGFAPGGGSDILARLIGQKVSERWGQAVVVDNRPGAGGTIALDLAAKASPDGYTLLVISGSQITNATLVTKVPFDIRTTYSPITQLTSQPYVLLVHPSVPAKSVRELVAHAKANPGKLNYASSGTGSSAHLGMELFDALAHVKMVHIPYKGSGQALVDLIGGQVQLLLASAISAVPNMKSGKVRALGVTSGKRSRNMPDLPTIAEAGVPGYESTIWLGMMAPAGTPKPVIDKLNSEINALMSKPDLIAAWDKQGAVPMKMTPKEFDDFLRKDIEKWAKVVKTANIKAQ